MERQKIISTTSLLFALTSFIIFILIILKKNNEIAELKINIKKDSIEYRQARIVNSELFQFKKIIAKIVPDRFIIPLGDTLRAHIMLGVSEMFVQNEPTEEPLILIGGQVDTNHMSVFGHIDTLKPSVWYPEIKKKTTKIGKDSIGGIYCLPLPDRNHYFKLPFMLYYKVIEKSEYDKIIK